MKKYIVALCLLFGTNIHAQEMLIGTGETLTERAMDSTFDEGWYWLNMLRGRWNPFGFEYLTRIYYRDALMRDKNSFWFANSGFNVGIEQSIGSQSRTSAYLYWQPVIAVNFTFKVGFVNDFVRFAAVDGPNADYNFGLPPFTGLNPMDRPPVYIGNQALEVEFAPQFTFGGPAGNGMLALIYTPVLLYVHAFGMNPNQYYLNNNKSVVLKAQDIFWQHDIKLGYSLTGTGISVALTGIIEHVQSYSGITRAGIFGAFSYEKAVKSIPTLVPFFRGQIGTWLKDRYMTQYFAVQFETGIVWKLDK